jgi:NAD(P) transhydrogenase subunit alpha
MKIYCILEERPGEKRTALTPELVVKYQRLGHEVLVEVGSGVAAGFPDQEYLAAGAKLVTANEITEADVVLSVNPLSSERISKVKAGALTISFLSPTAQAEKVAELANAKLNSISLEMVPRISRAQSMDALTSQALCAGYRAVLVGAEISPRFFPLLMTAAGTVTPAQVLVLGAGVAGLQAIATAKRLGAVVSAYDVRPSSADEVKSMGAKFINLELETLEGAGGYAREMTEERAAKQRELLTPYISAADVLITTAAVPGRAAPRLVTKEMLAGMKAGSVIIDIAAETGGNVEGSVAGELTIAGNGVKLWGGKDMPSQLPYHASLLFSRNIYNLLTLISTPKEGKPNGELFLNLEDEIIASALLTQNGEVRKRA